MRKILLLLLPVFFFTQLAFAQSPPGIQYQGIARDNTGSVYQNSAIALGFSIHDATAAGTVIYSESHSLTTNSFGLFTAVIGSGSVTSGSFSGINWGGGSKFLEVIIGGTSISTTQLQSVPYALYALSAGKASTGGSIQSGSGAPPGSGNTGDFYLDLSTYTLYGPYSAGWGSGTSLIGPAGSTGAIGTPGTGGTPGTNGTNGINGNTILSGNTLPASSTGNVGDFYIDLATATLFGPKAGTGWPGSGLSLTGPPGTFSLNATNGQTIYFDGSVPKWDTTSTVLVDNVTRTIGIRSQPNASAVLTIGSTAGRAEIFIDRPADTADIYTQNVLNIVSGNVVDYISPNGHRFLTGTMPTPSVTIIDPNGNFGINPLGFPMTHMFEVGGSAHVLSLRIGNYVMPTAIGNLNDVLTVTAGGVSWTPAAPGSLWSAAGNSIFPATLTNNVGIGINAPVEDLHIERGTNTSLGVISTSTSAINLGTPSNHGFGSVIYDNSSNIMMLTAAGFPFEFHGAGGFVIGPVNGFTQGVNLGAGSAIFFEGNSVDANNTIVSAADPTASRSIFFPDASGTVALDNTTWGLAGNSGTAPGTAAGSNYIGTSDLKELVIATNGTERMRFDLNGMVGINDPSPTASLSVSGNAKLASGKLFLGNVSGINSGYTGIYENSGDLVHAVFTSSAVSSSPFGSMNTMDAMRIKATTGFVGIASPNPTKTLSIGDGTVEKIGISGISGQVLFFDDQGSITFPPPNAGAPPMIHMFANGTTNPMRMVIGHSPGAPNWGLAYDDSPDKFHFMSNGAPVLTADLGIQRVGVNNPNPVAALDVSGNFKLGPNGTVLNNFIAGSTSLVIGTVNPASFTTLSLALAGANPGDKIFINAESGPNVLIVKAVVSAANTVSITVFNPGGTSLTGTITLSYLLIK